VVVVAVALNVTGFHAVVAFVLTLKYNLEPSGLFKEIVLPMVKYPDEASGPRVGTPPECVNLGYILVFSFPLYAPMFWRYK